ncbi:hypothetical protein BpHYR1_013390 [Brachionus plicatilis]|uniref:Uncharacterized protein n=1 Tax=Brachionus plicatilis TaxID=10195 RepID=A0A3M7PL99_BRAPC|nr:hypothetical protein BpHYR1_013390 [Brachionus plicatilis]
MIKCQISDNCLIIKKLRIIFCKKEKSIFICETSLLPLDSTKSRSGLKVVAKRSPNIFTLSIINLNQNTEINNFFHEIFFLYEKIEDSYLILRNFFFKKERIKIISSCCPKNII